MPRKSPAAADVLTDIMLTVFRVNARLLAKGDELVAPLQLTSARWQVLGAIALADRPATAPQIAATMGITRQGAQKQLNLALEDGLVEALDNPRHERSPQYVLTRLGRRKYDKTIMLEQAWARALVKGMLADDLHTASRLLNLFEARLETVPLPEQESVS